MQKLQGWIRERVMSGRLAPFTVPVTIVAVVVVIVLVALLLLTRSVLLQIDLGNRLLGYNLSDQTRIFVQLQRETLRLLIELSKSDEAYNVAAAQLQYDLLASRLYHINETTGDKPISPEVDASIVTLNTMWAVLSPAIEATLADPDDATLRADVISQLVAFEQLANTTEIEFNRTRASALVDFASASRQIPVIFVIATIALIALLIAVLVGLYQYIRSLQEAEAARQASQFKDQFLAVMSHELRTPLNAIIGFLGIMRMSGDIPERIVHMVDRSRANAERLLALINDILDLSKIEAGRFEIHPAEVVPNELFNQWKSQMDVLAGQKGLAFNVHLDDRLPERLMVDPEALTRIVTNLLSNAFKFTEKGAVTLDISAAETTWSIRVTDTGIGIPDDKKDQVFESFRQVDNSIRRNYGGSGLGLSITRQLVLLQHGQISLKSEVGVGSTFTVTLPLVVPGAASSTSSSSVAAYA